MSGTIGDAACTVSLSTLAEVQTLTSKRSLVNLAVVHTTERHADVLQLIHASRNKYSETIKLNKKFIESS